MTRGDVQVIPNPPVYMSVGVEPFVDVHILCCSTESWIVNFYAMLLRLQP